MTDKEDLTSIIASKIQHIEFDDRLDNSIRAIISGINYELDKFAESNASFLLSGSPNAASLFTMASYQPIVDDKNGIKRVMSEVSFLRDKYKIDLSDDIRRFVYSKLSKIKKPYLEVICGKQQVDLIADLLSKREVLAVTATIVNMEVVLDNFCVSESGLNKKLLELLFQVDPVFQCFKNNTKYKSFFPASSHMQSQYHAEKNLNFDFFKPVMNLVVKIYEKTFNQTQDSDDDSDNKSGKKM